MSMARIWSERLDAMVALVNLPRQRGHEPDNVTYKGEDARNLVLDLFDARRERDAAVDAMRNWVVCFHCNERMPAPAAEDHGRACPKHPQRQVEADLSRALSDCAAMRDEANKDLLDSGDDRAKAVEQWMDACEDRDAAIASAAALRVALERAARCIRMTGVHPLHADEADAVLAATGAGARMLEVVRAAEAWRDITLARIASLEKAHAEGGDRVAAFREHREDHDKATKALESSIDRLRGNGGPSE